MTYDLGVFTTILTELLSTLRRVVLNVKRKPEMLIQAVSQTPVCAVHMLYSQARSTLTLANIALP